MNAIEFPVLLVNIQLYIDYSHSLKEKRKVVKSLKDKLARRFNASVSEVAYLEEWQRAQLAVVMVSNDRKYLEQQAQGIQQLLADDYPAEALQITDEWL